MNWLTAGLLAAAVSFAVNRYAFRIWQEAVLPGPAPLTEEVAKTMAAHILGAGILQTHIVFGLTEALVDLRGSGRGLAAALSALAAHSLFGLLTVAVVRLTGMLGAGIVVAFLAHALWNAVMLLRPHQR